MLGKPYEGCGTAASVMRMRYLEGNLSFVQFKIARWGCDYLFLPPGHFGPLLFFFWFLLIFFGGLFQFSQDFVGGGGKKPPPQKFFNQKGFGFFPFE